MALSKEAKTGFYTALGVLAAFTLWRVIETRFSGLQNKLTG